MVSCSTHNTTSGVSWIIRKARRRQPRSKRGVVECDPSEVDVGRDLSDEKQGAATLTMLLGVESAHGWWPLR